MEQRVNTPSKLLLLLSNPLKFSHCAAELGFSLFSKHCKSRSTGFLQSHLIRINTLCYCNYILTLWIRKVDRINIGDIKAFSMKRAITRTCKENLMIRWQLMECHPKFPIFEAHYFSSADWIQIIDGIAPQVPPPIPWNQTSDVHRGSALIIWC